MTTPLTAAEIKTSVQVASRSSGSEGSSSAIDAQIFSKTFLLSMPAIRPTTIANGL